MQDGSRNSELLRLFNHLKGTPVPRVLLLGSSQVDVVKGDTDFSTRAMPYRLSSMLEADSIAHQILDLSAPGQQATESSAIAAELLLRDPPQAIVVGVGLFSMLRIEAREGVKSAVSPGALRAMRLRAPRDASLGVLTSERSALLRPADSTLQDRLDALIARSIGEVVPALAYRDAMYRELVDTPLRKDLVAYLQRRSGVKTARTYAAGDAYAGNLQSLAELASYCAQLQVHLLLVILPFDGSREPAPYEKASAAMMTRNVTALAREEYVQVLDLSHVLPASDFGTFADGSPDGLHFRASGHQVVASVVERQLRPFLRLSSAQNGGR